jgi:alpha-L-rhamnosidase
LVEPQLTTQLSSATARYETPNGEAAVSWQRRDGVVDLRVVVPVGATAHVHVPGTELRETVRHGEYTWRLEDPLTGIPDIPATVRDLLDDRNAWSAVVDAMTEAGIDDVVAAHRLAAHFDAPANRLPLLFTLEDYVPGALELRRRLEAVIEAIADGQSALSVRR